MMATHLPSLPHVRGVVAAVFCGLILAVGLAEPAAAHATLLFADPAIDGAVAESPEEVTLVFDEPVTLSGTPIVVTAAGGDQVGLGSAQTTDDGRVVTAPVSERLARGVFQVRWQVLSDDGDTIAGTFQFLVGPAGAGQLASAGAADDVATPGLMATATLRWLLFTAIALGLGGLLGARLARRRWSESVTTPAPPTRLAAIGGLVATSGLALLIVGNGSLKRGLSDPSLATLTNGRPGRVVLVELAAFIVVALLLRTPRWAAVPLIVVVIAEGLRAHAETAAPGWGALLTVLHVLAASLWAGALFQVVRTALTWRATPRLAWALIGDYARFAGWLFATVVVTGTAAALLLVPLDAWVSSGYGRVLIAKLLLVAMATALAVQARRHLRRGRGRGAPPGRAARQEWLALAAVFAVTGLLVSLPPPRSLGSSAPLPFPPPPQGLVLPLGARAGQVGVSAEASDGQLVVRLSAPDLDPSADDSDANVYTLGGSVASASGPAQKLSWKACGTGCFVAPTHWGDGVNQVSLDIGAHGWTGGTVPLVVPWPSRAGGESLRRTVATMRRIDTFTLYERVTSDTTGDPGNVTAFDWSGRRFLSVEPYGSGAATFAAVIGRQGGQVTLAVGFPAERAQAELVIDKQGRIRRETLTAPNHLIDRTFVYPEADGHESG